MASPALVLAARENGRKSRGPKTPEGKRKSSANSRKHGLYGSALPFDEQCEADRLDHLRICYECFPLSTSEAVALAHAAAEAKARQKWTRRLEHEFLSDALRSQEDPTIDMLRYGSNFYPRLHRLEMRFARQWWKARQGLCEIRARESKTIERTESVAESENERTSPIRIFDPCSSALICGPSKMKERTEPSASSIRFHPFSSVANSKMINRTESVAASENERTQSESLIRSHPRSSVAHQKRSNEPNPPNRLAIIP